MSQATQTVSARQFWAPPPAPQPKTRFAVSLHFQNRAGHLSRGGPQYPRSPWRALNTARHIIRQAGFTIMQAYTAFSGHWHPGKLPPGFTSYSQVQAARSTWLKAEQAALAIWAHIGPEQTQPAPGAAPQLRLVAAIRRPAAPPTWHGSIPF